MAASPKMVREHRGAVYDATLLEWEHFIDEMLMSSESEEWPIQVNMTGLPGHMEKELLKRFTDAGWVVTMSSESSLWAFLEPTDADFVEPTDAD